MRKFLAILAFSLALAPAVQAHEEDDSGPPPTLGVCIQSAETGQTICL